MLFGSLRNHVHRAELAAKLAFLERHAAVDEREKGMVLAHAHVHARIEFGAALTHEDVARDCELTAELLHAETTAGRITTVTRRAACLLMCHCLYSSNLWLTLPRPGSRPRQQRPSSPWGRPSSSLPAQD